MALPRLRSPLKLFIKTKSVSNEGDESYTLSTPTVIFSELIYRTSKTTDLDAPRQVVDVRAVIRKSGLFNAYRPDDYVLNFDGIDWRIETAIPHENQGYEVLTLKPLR